MSWLIGNAWVGFFYLKEILWRWKGLGFVRDFIKWNSFYQRETSSLVLIFNNPIYEQYICNPIKEMAMPLFSRVKERVCVQWQQTFALFGDFIFIYLFWWAELSLTLWTWAKSELDISGSSRAWAKPELCPHVMSLSWARQSSACWQP